MVKFDIKILQHDEARFIAVEIEMGMRIWTCVPWWKFEIQKFSMKIENWVNRKWTNLYVKHAMRTSTTKNVQIIN